MNADFYRAFEERYRGSRDLIKNRQRVYLPFVEKIQCFCQDVLVVDLGCGRGEWLELLGEQGIAALGIDLDDQMLAACRERNLPVETADAFTWLAARPDESCDLISVFHLAEHLPFDSLDQLVRHALRVLRPGGLLILETPNPENIIVGTADFYLDPTHQRPLPPPLLTFLAEYHGFGRTKIMRLQESAELAAGHEPTLFDVLGGVSPDYAVIAQKRGDADLMAAFDVLFARDYGVKLAALALRYDQAHQQSVRNAFELARQAIEKGDALFVQQQQQAQAFEQRVQQQTQEFHQQVQQQAQAFQQQVQALYASRSWRLTAPLRAVGRLLRWFVSGSIAWLTFAPMSRPYRVVRQLIIRLKMFISVHPSLKTLILRWLAPFPRLKAQLIRVVSQPMPAGRSFGIGKPEQLSPRARQLYTALKAAMEQRQKEHC